jgi:hypothetical protein
MSEPWMSISDAAVRLRLSPHEVLKMAVSGELHSRLKGDHREVCAGAVAAYAEEQRPGAMPSVHGGPSLPLEIEADYERRKDHDDTPNDEGDETPCR